MLTLFRVQQWNDLIQRQKLNCRLQIIHLSHSSITCSVSTPRYLLQSDACTCNMFSSFWFMQRWTSNTQWSVILKKRPRQCQACGFNRCFFFFLNYSREATTNFFQLGHFQVTLYLCFKTSPCAKPLKWIEFDLRKIWTCKWNTFSYGFTQTCFDTEAKGNSEMAHNIV